MSLAFGARCRCECLGLLSGGALTLHATWDQLKLLPRVLRDELEVAMALCGCRTLEQIPPDLLWPSS